MSEKYRIKSDQEHGIANYFLGESQDSGTRADPSWILLKSKWSSLDKVPFTWLIFLCLDHK